MPGRPAARELTSPVLHPRPPRACAGPTARTLGDVVRPRRAGPFCLVSRLRRLPLGLHGAPALGEHVRQAGCGHLPELLIVAQGGCQVPVFACGPETAREYGVGARTPARSGNTPANAGFVSAVTSGLPARPPGFQRDARLGHRLSAQFPAHHGCPPAAWPSPA